jgi:LysM repeat protein
MNSFTSLAAKAFTLLLALAVLAAVLPPAAPALAAPAAATCVKNYTVVSGDTLSKVADDNKLTVLELATANNLKEPYTLQIGQVLCIPGTATTTTTTSGSSTSTSTGTKPTFTILVNDGFLTIKTANYPAKTNYYIRAANGIRRLGTFYKVGLLHVKKNAAVERTVRLPKSLRNAASLTVCLKNALNDSIQCKIWTGNPAP